MNATSTPRRESEGLSISVVVYRPDLAQLVSTLASLAAALDALHSTRPNFRAELYLVDNGSLPDVDNELAALRARHVVCTTLSGHGNVGYGRGHNLAIGRSAQSHHLVLNPDVEVEPGALVRAFDFFDANPEVGLLTPRIGDERGHFQFLCRRYPTVLDLFVRGFLPARLRAPFAARLARYEMRDVINERDIVWDPAIVSGCFMLFRTDVLKRLRGFDDRYFLYFEDYDISLRASELARVVYLPAVQIVHHGGGAARKGWLHIRLFVTSMVRFFNRFGWKWL